MKGSIVGIVGLGFAFIIGGWSAPEDRSKIDDGGALESTGQALVELGVYSSPIARDCGTLQKNGEVICDVSYSAAVIKCNFDHADRAELKPECLAAAEAEYNDCGKKTDVAMALCVADE